MKANKKLVSFASYLIFSIWIFVGLTVNQLGQRLFPDDMSTAMWIGTKVFTIAAFALAAYMLMLLKRE